MSVSGPDARSFATELVSEARRRLLDALLRPRATTDVANAKPAQVAANAKLVPSGLDPGRTRLAATMLDAQMLEAASAEGNKSAPIESAAARVVSNYLAQESLRAARSDAAFPSDRPDTAQQTIAGARPDLVVALGSPLFRNRQIEDFDTLAAPNPNDGRQGRRPLAAEAAIKKKRMDTRTVLATLMLAAGVLLLTLIF